MRGGVYRLEGVERRHGERLALSIDSLHVRHGDILGLAGPNGSGKSTLLRILALLDAPTRGRLWFQGREIAAPSSADRRRVSLLLQEPYLLKKSVFENVAYGLRVRGENHDAPARVGQALEWVGLDPANFAPRAWHKLSGGEAQRVALAARLVLKPKVLLMDEPTASLDASSGVLIKEAALRARREWGTTLVIASHDLLWLYAVSDQVLNLHQGRLAGAEPISLIPGPWEHAPGGRHWRTILGDGRQVLAQAPESPDDGKQRLAVIRPGDIRLHAERPRETEGANLLKGEVIHASLERSSGQVLIQVSVDRLSFLVRLNDHAHGGMNLLPGIQLWISFPAQAVNWL